MFDPNPDREAARQLEVRATDELEQIPGVLAAAVWLRDQRRIREAYITAAPGTSLANLQRAVAGVLRSNGLAFSADIVHIAVLDESATPPPLWRGRFLVLDSLEVCRAQNHATCRIQLLRRGAPVTGEARELDTETGRARAAARATLNAAEQATRGIHLGLEGVQILDLFGKPFVAVSVEAASFRRLSRLPGINAIDRTVEDAACLATLGAIERWLAW